MAEKSRKSHQHSCSAPNRCQERKTAQEAAILLSLSEACREGSLLLKGLDQGRITNQGGNPSDSAKHFSQMPLIQSLESYFEVMVLISNTNTEEI